MDGTLGTVLPRTFVQGSSWICDLYEFVLANERTGHAVGVALALSDAPFRKPIHWPSHFRASSNKPCYLFC